jgi:hypothetical protein
VTREGSAAATYEKIKAIVEAAALSYGQPSLPRQFDGEYHQLPADLCYKWRAVLGKDEFWIDQQPVQQTGNALRLDQNLA